MKSYSRRDFIKGTAAAAGVLAASEALTFDLLKPVLDPLVNISDNTVRMKVRFIS